MDILRKENGKTAGSELERVYFGQRFLHVVRNIPLDFVRRTRLQTFPERMSDQFSAVYHEMNVGELVVRLEFAGFGGFGSYR